MTNEALLGVAILTVGNTVGTTLVFLLTTSLVIGIIAFCNTLQMLLIFFNILSYFWPMTSR